MKSVKHRYADILLPTPLAEHVAEARSEGRSWRRIEIEIRDLTNGEVDISHETLRAWFPEPAAQ